MITITQIIPEEVLWFPQSEKSESKEHQSGGEKKSNPLYKVYKSTINLSKENKSYPEAKNKERRKIKLPGDLRHTSKRQTVKNKKKVNT